jgi:hypothetical protein
MSRVLACDGCHKLSPGNAGRQAPLPRSWMRVRVTNNDNSAYAMKPIATVDVCSIDCIQPAVVACLTPTNTEGNTR